jgi:hypothetical protein
VSPELKFDPSNYPRTYTSSIWWKGFMSIVGGILCVGGLAGLLYFGTGHEVGNTAGLFILVGMSLLLAIMGAFIVISIVRAKVVLTEIAIERHEGFKVEKMRRDSISGYRVRNVKGINILELTPKLAGMKKMKFELLFKPDNKFNSWLEGIENLDQSEYNKSVKEIEQDASLGTTPEARLSSLKRANKIGRFLQLGSFACLFWVMLYPYPYLLSLTVIALFPWIAMMLSWKYGGLFTIEDPTKKTAKSDLTSLLIMPGFALSLRALYDTNLIDFHQIIIPSIVGTLLMIFFVINAAPVLRNQLGKLALLTILLISYPGGLIPLANVIADYSHPVNFKVSILAKRHTSGKGASAYFGVTSWGGEIVGDSEVRTSWVSYRNHVIGDYVCISLHSGAFGLKWYAVNDSLFCD